MSKIHQIGDEHWAFWCPGCDRAHGVNARWTFNGDFERPTINPSVLVVGGEPACHSFIVAGRASFLTDCTHQYAGMTIDLPDWPYDD